jgi:hypothetical protein
LRLAGHFGGEWAEDAAMAKDDAAADTALEVGALARRTRLRRAIEAAIRGLPLVAFDALACAFEGAAGTPNEILWWPRPGGWRQRAPAPDPEALALVALLDTRTAGPVVLELPPADDSAIAGVIVDGGLRALCELGARGLGGGAGGRYLVLPPAYHGDTPNDCFVLPAPYWRGAALLQARPRGAAETDRVRAASHLARVRIYPLAAAGRPPATRFVDAGETIVDAGLAFDLRLFEALDRAAQAGPCPLPEPALAELLEAVGIVHGKPFAPDAQAAALLADAAAEARAWLHAIDEAARPSWSAYGHWHAWHDHVAADAATPPGVTAVDLRALAALRGRPVRAAEAGADPACLLTRRDRRGEPLEGGLAYRLHLPAGLPAADGWSITACEADTHAPLRDVPHGMRSSRAPELAGPPDAPVDLFFGPTPPAGKEGAWISTRTGVRWEAVLRLHRPGPAWREQAWAPGDLERR